MTTQNVNKNKVHWIILLICAVSIALFLAIAVIRLFYPLELESMEGGMFVWLNLAHRTGIVFPPPNPDYVPFLYPGFYIYLALGISFILGGPSFIPLRLISILATLGTAALVGSNLGERTKPKKILSGGGIYLATYFALYTWYDVGRVDMLAIFLAMLGYSLVVKKSSPFMLIMAGLAMGLSFATKQSYLTLILPAIIYLLVRNLKHLLYFFIGFLLGGPLVYLGIDMINQGNSWTYIYDIPSHLAYGSSIIKIFVLFKHLAMMAPLLIIALWQFISEIRLWDKGWLKRFLGDFWAMAFLWGLIVGVLFILQAGAVANTMVIFVATVSIYTARWVWGHALSQHGIWKVGILSVSVIFCWFSDGPPWDKIPPQQRLDYYSRLLVFIGEEPRPNVPEFPDLVIMAGAPSNADNLALIDLRRVNTKVRQEYAQRQEQCYYSLVIIGLGGGGEFWTQNNRYKEVGQNILEPLSIPNDFGHYPIQPISIYIPSDRDEAGVIDRLKQYDLIPR